MGSWTNSPEPRAALMGLVTAPERMSDGKLRQAIALEAARLMYERVESEYFTAKRKAAKRLCRRGVKPEDLPSNAEIREQIQLFARIHERDHRQGHRAGVDPGAGGAFGPGVPRPGPRRGDAGRPGRRRPVPRLPHAAAAAGERAGAAGAPPGGGRPVPLAPGVRAGPGAP